MVLGVLVAVAPRMMCRQGNSRSTLHMTQTSDGAEGTTLVCLHGVIWHSCSAHQETCGREQPTYTVALSKQSYVAYGTEAGSGRGRALNTTFRRPLFLDHFACGEPPASTGDLHTSYTMCRFQRRCVDRYYLRQSAGSRARRQDIKAPPYQ